jgi:hypothetical protein
MTACNDGKKMRENREKVKGELLYKQLIAIRL